MKRNKISLKKANLISAAHKSKTSNPFWINGFYDLIKEYVVDPGLFPAQVCNTDKSSFPTGPAKAKAIAPIGKSYKQVNMQSWWRKHNYTNFI